MADSSGPETFWGWDNGESLPPYALQASGMLMPHSRVPTVVFACLRGGGPLEQWEPPAKQLSSAPRQVNGAWRGLQTRPISSTSSSY